MDNPNKPTKQQKEKDQLDQQPRRSIGPIFSKPLNKIEVLLNKRKTSDNEDVGDDSDLFVVDGEGESGKNVGDSPVAAAGVSSQQVTANGNGEGTSDDFTMLVDTNFDEHDPFLEALEKLKATATWKENVIDKIQANRGVQVDVITERVDVSVQHELKKAAKGNQKGCGIGDLKNKKVQAQLPAVSKKDAEVQETPALKTRSTQSNRTLLNNAAIQTELYTVDQETQHDVKTASQDVQCAPETAEIGVQYNAPIPKTLTDLVDPTFYNSDFLKHFTLGIQIQQACSYFGQLQGNPLAQFVNPQGSNIFSGQRAITNSPAPPENSSTLNSLFSNPPVNSQSVIPSSNLLPYSSSVPYTQQSQMINPYLQQTAFESQGSQQLPMNPFSRMGYEQPQQPSNFNLMQMMTAFANSATAPTTDDTPFADPINMEPEEEVIDVGIPPAPAQPVQDLSPVAPRPATPTLVAPVVAQLNSTPVVPRVTPVSSLADALSTLETAPMDSSSSTVLVENRVASPVASPVSPISVTPVKRKKAASGTKDKSRKRKQIISEESSTESSDSEESSGEGCSSAPPKKKGRRTGEGRKKKNDRSDVPSTSTAKSSKKGSSRKSTEAPSTSSTKNRKDPIKNLEKTLTISMKNSEPKNAKRKSRNAKDFSNFRKKKDDNNEK